MEPHIKEKQKTELHEKYGILVDALEAAGYEPDGENGVWRRRDYHGIPYSDGDETEQDMRQYAGIIVANNGTKADLAAKLAEVIGDIGIEGPREY